MLLRHDIFHGIAPAAQDTRLPDGYAVQAHNVDLRQQIIAPLKGTASVFSHLPSSAKYVYSPDGFVFLTSSNRLQAYLSPVTQDVYSRIYYTDGNKIRVTTKGALHTDGSAPSISYIPGVPTPTPVITVEKVRKNRWPNHPSASLKGTFFIENNGMRFYETEVNIIQSPGSKPFSKYYFDVGINYKEIITNASVTTDLYRPLPETGVLYVTAIYLIEETIINGETFAGNTWILFEGSAVIGATTVSIDRNGVAFNFPRNKFKYIKSYELIYTTVDNIEPTVSSNALPALELWLDAGNGERIWTAYVNTVSMGVVTTIPGGISISMAPTGVSTFEITLTFGVIEDRAYVYTLVNEWSEESAPSMPVNVFVTFIDDVVLRVDVDKCISLFKNELNELIYCPFKRIQFYCAGVTGTYQAVATSPTGTTVANSISITDLYNAILGRDPDPEGLQYWTNMYNSGMSISEIAWNMFNSAEYRHYESGYIIEELYTGLLNRQPDAQGYNYYRGVYENGASLQDIVWSFLVSDEFAALRPTLVRNTGADFINFVYNTYLGRNADAGALQAWLYNAPFNWDYWASYVIATILNSEEYKAIVMESRVTDLLTIAYGRAPTQQEIDDAIEKLQNGYTLPSLLMNESSVTSDGFLDEGNRIGWELQTNSWGPPPPDLESLALLPNGVFAAIRETEIWFSEPYLSFAWPPKYIQNVSNKLKALMPYGGNLLAITDDKPVVITGPHPGAMTQVTINVTAPGISRNAVTAVNGNPIYATPEGLFMVDGMTGNYSISKSFWTIENWKELYGDYLDTISLAYHDGRLIGIFSDIDGFIIDFHSERPILHTHSVRGFSFFTIPRDINIYVTGNGCKKLFVGQPLPYTWKSKSYVFKRPTSFGAGVVTHRGSITLKVYTESGLKFEKSFTALDNVTYKRSFFRLPSGERHVLLGFEISSSTGAIVESIHFGNTMTELGDV